MPVQTLSQTEKNSIVYRYNGGESKAALARDYGVSPRTIGRVIQEAEEHDQELDLEDELLDLMEDEIRLGYVMDEWDNIDDEDIFDEPEEHEPSYEYHVVATPISLAITRVNTLTGNSTTVSADPSNESFSLASEVVWDGRGSQESLKQAFEVLDRKTFIEKYSNGLVTVDPEAGRVYYNVGGYHQEFNGRLVSRLIEGLSNGSDNIDNLIRFTERLALNDSNRAIDELYNFLEAACIDIDKEGYVIAFKKVRDTYFDIYSNSIDNSPGQSPEVPRKMVDEDSERTCSHGLHVCSSSYLPHFGSCYGNRIVKVRVDPKDFVAVPKDYNDAKARVCKYTVLEDVTEAMYETDVFS